MDTVGDVLAAARSREGTALRLPTRQTPHSHRELVTTAWKAGNLLAHTGAGAGGRVAVAIGPADPDGKATSGRLHDTAAPLLAALGALRLGAPVDLAPAASVAARALVAPAAWLGRFDADPGCSRLAYGAAPVEPDVSHFERDCWSENPVEPPESVEPAQVALVDGGDGVTHRDLAAAAARVVRETGLEPGDTVHLDAGVDTPGGFAAGVLAPLAAGATIRPVGGSAEATPADGSKVDDEERVDSGDDRRGDVLRVSDAGDGDLDPETVL